MEVLTNDQINAMSPSERLDLIGQLWDSLDPENIPLTPEQMSELDRRLATLDEDRKNCITWDEMKAQIEQRYR